MQKKINKIILIILFFLDVIFASEVDLTSEKYILYNGREKLGKVFKEI